MGRTARKLRTAPEAETRAKSTEPRSLSKIAIPLLLAVILVVGAIGLAPELSISQLDKNDNVSHFRLITGMVDALERGGNPLDFWTPDWSFGYPLIRDYQALPHLLVVLIYFLLGKSVALITVFTWVRYLSLVLLPLSFWVAARQMELPEAAAVSAAALGPLVATNGLYGIDYSSYVWNGHGLFPQALAVDFLLIAIGYGWRAVRTGAYPALAGALLGLTAACHFIYGYLGALTIVLIAVIPNPGVTTGVRIGRILKIAAVSLLLSAFQLAPLLVDRRILNHSQAEGAWKWDSVGAATILKFLFTGQLLDQNRLPILSILALTGALMILWRIRFRRAPAHEIFILSGALLWTLLLFGRPTWGPVLYLLAVPRDMHLHRVIGATQIFLVLVASLGLAAVWRLARARGSRTIAALAAGVLLVPMVWERADYLATNAAQGEQNLAAFQAEQHTIQPVIANAARRTGRVYAGLTSTWGNVFRVGSDPFYAILSMYGIPQTSFSYHTLALTHDLMIRFDELNPDLYRLFGVGTVVVPSGAPGVPAFLTPRVTIGRFRVFDAPGASYFDLVDAVASVQTNKDTFYEINDRWMHSDLVPNKAHLLLDFDDGVVSGLPHWSGRGPLPKVTGQASAAGTVEQEKSEDPVYEAQIAAARSTFLLFKMTWHPNWHAYVDGKREPTVMLSPGFLGVALRPGLHRAIFRYEPRNWKSIIGLVGFLLAALVVVAERKVFVRQQAGKTAALATATNQPHGAGRIGR